jgi:hypothetical protein
LLKAVLEEQDLLQVVLLVDRIPLILMVDQVVVVRVVLPLTRVQVEVMVMMVVWARLQTGKEQVAVVEPVVPGLLDHLDILVKVDWVFNYLQHSKIPLIRMVTLDLVVISGLLAVVPETLVMLQRESRKVGELLLPMDLPTLVPVELLVVVMVVMQIIIVDLVVEEQLMLQILRVLVVLELSLLLIQLSK